MNQSNGVFSTEFNVSALLEAPRWIGQRDQNPRLVPSQGECQFWPPEKKFS